MLRSAHFPNRLSGSLDSWSEFLQLCMQAFVRDCRLLQHDVPFLAPLPSPRPPDSITRPLSLIIIAMRVAKPHAKVLLVQSHLVKESITIKACGDKFPVMVAAHSSLLS